MYRSLLNAKLYIYNILLYYSKKGKSLPLCDRYIYLWKTSSPNSKILNPYLSQICLATETVDIWFSPKLLQKVHGDPRTFLPNKIVAMGNSSKTILRNFNKRFHSKKILLLLFFLVKTFFSENKMPSNKKSFYLKAFFPNIKIFPYIQTYFCANSHYTLYKHIFIIIISFFREFVIFFSSYCIDKKYNHNRKHFSYH